MNPQFFKALPEDAPLLAPLNKRLIEDEGHRNPMTVPQLAERMARWLEGEYSAAYMLVDGEMAGYALWRDEGDHAYLRQLFVERNWRKQGLGKALYRWLEENTFASKRVRLEVLVGNAEGKAFWAALGFKEYCLTMERDGKPGQKITAVEPWIKEILDSYAGIVLTRRKYTPYSADWDHDHCDICGRKIMEKSGPDVDVEGYSTDDSYNWFCLSCVSKYGAHATWALAG